MSTPEVTALTTALAETAVQEKSTGPLKLPIAAPTASSKPKEHEALTEEQQKKYGWLLEQIKALTEVPSTKDKAGPLTDSEKQWLSRECLLRYLRATKWHEKEAEKRIIKTLTWRREYGVETIPLENPSLENETGKQIILGYDKEARVCHYLNPGRQNTQASPRQVQHLVYMLERVIDLMPAGVETLSLMIDFKPSKTRANTHPGIAMAREVLDILQNHYPERLGRALIINVPWVVHGFFKLITPFIDPHTREKLKFNEDMSQYVPKEHLWTTFKGDLDFDYDHSVYWPAMNKLATERREKRTERWIAGGKHIGESEDYLNGKTAMGISGIVTPVAQPAAEEKAEDKKVEASQEKPEEAKKEDAAEPVAATEVKAPVEVKAEEVKKEETPAS